MYAKSKEKAMEAFNELKETMGSDAKRAVNTIEKDLDSLLTFFDFPQEFWNPLRTSNAIERVNKEFKRRTKSMGTVGEKNLEILIAFIALRLEQGWQKNPINATQFKNLANVRNPIESSLNVLLENKIKHGEILNLH